MVYYFLSSLIIFLLCKYFDTKTLTAFIAALILPFLINIIAIIIISVLAYLFLEFYERSNV